MLRLTLGCGLLLAIPLSVNAAPTDAPTPDELASTLRGLMNSALPEPLVAQDFNWGNQKEYINGITWEKCGLLYKPFRHEKLKNDGMWRRIKVEAIDPKENLTVNVGSLLYPEKGKVTFDVLVTLPTRITFEQQCWLAGLCYYSGETRARCRPQLLLRCESTTRTQKNGTVVPDVVFRMRAVDGRLSYDQFKVEKTAGVSGEVARILGDAAHSLLNQVQPSLERNVLEKATKSIVQAADTKDVKLSFGKLVHGQ